MQQRIDTSSRKFVAARRLKRVLTAAFAVIATGLVLFVALAVIAFDSAQQRLIDISRQEQIAFESLLQMMDAARERLLILHSIHASDDRFEIEALVETFHAQGTVFAQANAVFAELEMRPEEMDLLGEQRQIAFEILRVAQQAIDLVRAGERLRAERLIIDEVHPRQSRMLKLLVDILGMHSDRAYEQTVAATRLEQRVNLLLLLFGMLGAVLIGLIAFFVVRHVSRTTETIEDQSARLRASLNEVAFHKMATDQHNIVSVADAAGNITYANARFVEVSQYSLDELIGKNHRILRSDVHDQAFYRRMWETISAGEIWQGEICNRRKDGGLYWVATTIVPFLDEADLPYQYVSVRTDITRIKEAETVLLRSKEELEAMVEDRTAALARTNEQLAREIQGREKLQKELEELATTDPLTGLSNRREFNQAMCRELRRAERYVSPLSLILIDIDHFKRINDMHGHQAGDAVLRAFADLVRKEVREQDVLARWGGEEFALLCPNTDLEGAVVIAEKVGYRVRECAFPAVGGVTCSLGVAAWREGEQQSEWISRVDAALYDAKGSGRDQVVSHG